MGKPIEMEVKKQYPKSIDVFLAGVIQGSQAGTRIEEQDYRKRLQNIFEKVDPDLEVYCPFEHHSDSVEYDDQEGKKVFLKHLDMAKTARLLVCYLPTASLGTSIELWECNKSKVPIVAISPMAHNWVLRFFTGMVFPTMDDFERWLTPKNLEKLIAKK